MLSFNLKFLSWDAKVIRQTECVYGSVSKTWCKTAYLYHGLVIKGAKWENVSQAGISRKTPLCYMPGRTLNL